MPCTVQGYEVQSIVQGVETDADGRPFGEMIPAEELIDNADQSSIELGPGAIIDLNPGEEV